MKIIFTASPPGSPPEPIGVVGTPSGMNPLEMTRLSLWNFCSASASPEPQKEALNLEKREDRIPPPPPKRPHTDNEETHMPGAHIKISTRGN